MAVNSREWQACYTFQFDAQKTSSRQAIQEKS
jgi:hypothetical protein